MSQLKETNATLAFYCDLRKIVRNVESIEIKLNQLNYLIGQDDLATAVRRLWEENPKAFGVMSILIAVRKKDKKKVLDNMGSVRLIDDYFQSPEGVMKFLDATGLSSLIQSKKIKNFVDYVFGVEVGLDSNARKSRSGAIMEDYVSKVFTASNVPFRREVHSAELPDFNVLGEDDKRFDFVIPTKRKTYLVEVNFYNTQGSKLNEVARAYTELSPKINSTELYEFVWITDGIGWTLSRNKLEEAFYAIPNIYNLTTIGQFVRQVQGELL